MCGEALKNEIAFQEEDVHEIRTRHIAGGTTFLIRKLGEMLEQFTRWPDETSIGPVH